MARYQLNRRRLYDMVDAQRQLRGLTWTAVNEQVGVHVNTFFYLKRGKCPNGDTLISVLTWLDLDLGDLAKKEEADG